MSVNLNKQSGEKPKVSLQKNEIKRETAGGKTVSNAAGSMGEEKKDRLWLWAGLSIAAVAAVVFFAVFSIGRGSRQNNSEAPALAINEGMEIETAADEGNTDGNSTVEDYADEANDAAGVDDAGENTQPEESGNIQNPAEDSSDVADSVQRTDDTSIHRYEIIVADVTWSEAFSDCIARGGYLCRINSPEENEKIKELLIEQNIRGVVYLGGMRAEDSDEYYWIDENKNPYEERINAGEYMQFWYNGEPSYADTIDGEEIAETYMAFIYPGATKEWAWNDVCDDVLSLAPDFYSGKLSYICEYE